MTELIFVFDKLVFVASVILYFFCITVLGLFPVRMAFYKPSNISFLVAFLMGSTVTGF